ncbi:hypothetical protein D3C80_1172270 [compost metagenome]
MPHVGIKRLGTGQRQYDRPEDCHAHARVNDKEAYRPGRAHRLEHLGMLDDAIHAQCTQRKKPDHHDWPEQDADAFGAMALNQKQCHQHDQ